MDYAGAEILKSFPALQLAAGMMVIIVGVYLTLRAAKDNKRDGHVAPPSHDPLGLTVIANNFAGMAAQHLEQARQQTQTLQAIHGEQIKTNSRLAELKDSHESRWTSCGARCGTGSRRRRRAVVVRHRVSLVALTAVETGRL